MVCANRSPSSRSWCQPRQVRSPRAPTSARSLAPSENKVWRRAAPVGEGRAMRCVFKPTADGVEQTFCGGANTFWQAGDDLGCARSRGQQTRSGNAGASLFCRAGERRRRRHTRRRAQPADRATPTSYRQRAGRCFSDGHAAEVIGCASLGWMCLEARARDDWPRAEPCIAEAKRNAIADPDGDGAFVRHREADKRVTCPLYRA